MKDKTVSGIMLILLFANMLPLMVNIQLANSSTTIFVPDDYEKIQWAVGNASDGDTVFVRAGTYYEKHVLVNKKVSLIGENRSTTIIDGSGCDWREAVINITTTNVNISEFTVQNGYYGLYLGASNCTIIENRIRNNQRGIYLRNSKYNLLYENVVENNYVGIYSRGSGSNTINKNTFKDNNHGIDLWEDSNNIVIGNIIKNSELYGIYAYHSHTNIMSGNTIKYTSGHPVIPVPAYAIFLDRSNGNEIFANIIVNNTFAGDAGGISVYDSRDNILRGNTIAYNFKGVTIGGYLTSSHYYNNTVLDNTIRNNKWGISLHQYANYNKIYHNNLIDNERQAYIDEFSSNNTWDDGYPSGGNYWSDHVCDDNPSNGSQQYVINVENIDLYPFQDQNGWLLPLHVFEVMWYDKVFNVVVESNSTVSNFYFNQQMKEIGLNVSGPVGATGFCNITIPKNLLKDGWEVTLDEQPTPLILTENVTHTTLYFTYTYSAHKVRIIGTWVVSSPSKYTLTIFSSPPGVPFTVNGEQTTTPWSGNYSEDTPVSLDMPQTHDKYGWDHWLEDGDTSNTKRLTIDTNITLTAIYKSYVSGVLSVERIVYYNNTEFTVYVYLTNITDCAGYQFWIDYNSTVLEYVGHTFDTDPANPLSPTQMAPASSDRFDTDMSVPGSVKLATVWTAGVPSYSGSGVAAHITFKGETVGNSTLAFNTAWTYAVNSLGDEIYFEFKDCKIEVRLMGDANGDFDVDVGDQRRVQLAMFAAIGEPRYTQHNTYPLFTDMEADGDVDVGDQRKQQLHMFESW